MKRQKSILVVDDEVDFGEIIIDLLSPLYETVTFCSSPKKAKEYIQTTPYSMILSDVNMPEIPGPEFVAFVRSFGRIEPIIFITGNATKEMVLSAIRLGAADVLEKPFEEAQLLKTIDRVFDLEKRRLQLYEAIFNKTDSTKEIEKQKKMIGLLQVVNDRKKSSG